MNKKDLIDEVAHKTELTKKEIDTVLNLLLEIIMHKVSAGEKVRLVGFGSFYKSDKKLKMQFTGSNHTTTVCVAKFSPGKFFKQRINLSE